MSKANRRAVLSTILPIAAAIRCRATGAAVVLAVRRTVLPGCVHGLAWIVLVLLAWVALIPAVQAQEIKTIQGDKTLVVFTSPKPIEKPKASFGSVKVVESMTTPKTYTLLYVAPIVDTDISDTVAYTLDGDRKSVQVDVTARAQPPTLTSSEIYVDSFKALFVLFIIAVVLESGLALVFNWRPFIEFFDSRGVKTIIMFAFSYFFVEVFSLDITTRLVNVYSGSDWPVNFPGKIVTALVLAGGSSGVNNLFLAFGFRSVERKQQVAPKPKPGEAWIAVKLTRMRAKGPVSVLIGPQAGPLTVAGTISGTSKGNRGLRYFLRDRGRFPTAGGHSLEPAKSYEVKLEGVDDEGRKITSSVWGPYEFAKGAIVDLEMPL
jgi:hypothetical protein